MTNVTAKSTKAQLLQHIEELNAELAATTTRADRFRAEALASRISPQQRATMIWSEFKALVVDTYRLGAWCRKGFDQTLDNLRLTVNNDRRARSRSEILHHLPVRKETATLKEQHRSNPDDPATDPRPASLRR